MGMDFNVDVNVQTNATGLDKVEKQIEKIATYDGKTINLDFNATGLDKVSILNNLTNIANNPQVQQAGVKAGKILSKGVKQALKTDITSKGINIPLTVDKKGSDAFQKAVDKEIAKIQGKSKKPVSVSYKTDLVDAGEVLDQNGNKQIRKVEKLTGAVFKYQNEAGAAITKTMKWAEIGKDKKDNPIMGWVQGATTYNKQIGQSIKQTDSFAKKQRETIANFKNTIKQVETNAYDKNSARPIKAQSSVDRLKMESAYVENAMYDLEHSNASTFDNAKIKAQEAITNFKILEKQLRNSDNVATSLRTKDFGTVKAVEERNLQKFINDVKTSNVPFADMEQDINNLKTELNGAFDATSLTEYLNKLDVAKAKLKETSAQINANNKASILDAKKSGFQFRMDDLERISPEIAGFTATIGNEQVTLQSLAADLAKINSAGDMSVITQKFNAFKEAAKAAGYAVKEVATNTQSIQKNIGNLKFDSDFASMTAKLKEFEGHSSSDNYKIAKQSLADYETALGDLKKHFDPNDAFTLDDNSYAAAVKQLTEANERFGNSFSMLKTEAKGSFNALEGATVGNKIQSYLRENTRLTREYRDALTELESKARAGDNLTEIKKQFSNIQSEISAKGLGGKSPITEIKRAAQQIAEFTGIHFMLQNAMIELPQKMYASVKDINKAQIELMKVSDAPVGKLEKYWDEAAVSARKYGSSISDIIQSTADWSRLGYDLDQSKELANATTLIQKVGDNMTQEKASQGVISAIQGFSDVNVDEVQRVVDVVNEVSNTEPIDSAGIFDALTRSASSMSAANNTFEETVALITAANSVVQDPDSIGTAFKTKFLRNCLYVQKCA